MTEEWRLLEWTSGRFSVSNFGGFRQNDCPNKKRSYIKPNGYIGLSINKKHYLLHRLVAQAFIPNPENKPQVNHKDGNPTNNTVGNLEWATSHENMLHKCRVLKKTIGETNWASKLKSSQIPEIRRLISIGVNDREIGDMFGVSFTAIRYVRKGWTWIHVPTAA